MAKARGPVDVPLFEEVESIVEAELEALVAVKEEVSMQVHSIDAPERRIIICKKSNSTKTRVKQRTRMDRMCKMRPSSGISSQLKGIRNLC